MGGPQGTACNCKSKSTSSNKIRLWMKYSLFLIGENSPQSEIKIEFKKKNEVSFGNFNQQKSGK
jgi:hypothetical protein